MGFEARSDVGLICVVNSRMILVDSDWNMLGCSEMAVFSHSRVPNAPIRFFFVETCGSTMQSGDSVPVFVKQKYRHARFASWENSPSVALCACDYGDRRRLRSRRKRHFQFDAFGDRLQQTKSGSDRSKADYSCFFDFEGGNNLVVVSQVGTRLTRSRRTHCKYRRSSSS